MNPIPILNAVTLATAVLYALPPELSATDIQSSGAPTATWVPADGANHPMGEGRGIFPGRVVWARDLAATPWDGKTGNWWDEGTGIRQSAVDSLLSRSLRTLTGESSDEAAWTALFKTHNRSRSRGDVGYRTGEKIAIKINCNNAYEGYGDVDGQIDQSPQVVLGVVRQLIEAGRVPAGAITLYEATRVIPDRVYAPVHTAYPEVRFVDSQGDGKNGRDPVDYQKDVLRYSIADPKVGRDMPRCVVEATYLINLALIKGHPTTGVTLTAKNHYGTVNVRDHEVYVNSHAHPMGIYHPFVDMIGSKELGGKTVLFVLDGLYGVRDVNDRVAEHGHWNRLFGGEWLASLFVSQDPVAIDSVGFDLLRSEFPFGRFADYQVTRHSDNYLHQAAEPWHGPDGLHYAPDGEPLRSLGVHEHWNNAVDRKYSRDLDPAKGRGIELVRLQSETKSASARIILPGRGVAQHPFLYAGEWDTRKPQTQSMFIVREGRIAWQFTMPLKTPEGKIQEFDDATLRPNGNIVYSHMSGASEVTPDKKVIWNYAAPDGHEVHSAQPLRGGRVLIMQNGSPAEALLIETATGRVERRIRIPTTRMDPHGQFRHIRLTSAGTLLVPHLGEDKVVEYDQNGKVLWEVAAKSPWSAIRLKNGNTLIAGDWSRYAREVNPKGETVWEFTQADLSGIELHNVQTAQRLANGNTVLCCWVAGNPRTDEWRGSIQVLEVTREKTIVWALSAWDDPDLGPATSIQLLDEPGDSEMPGDQQR